MGHAQRPVLAIHLVMTCYGFWLPNDPRGSGSTEVWSDALKPFGPAQYVDSSKSVARQPHDLRIRKLAKSALKYPQVQLTGEQARVVAQGMASYMHKRNIVCHAFAIMPEHVHLVLMQMHRDVSRVASELKAAATKALSLQSLHPHERFRDKTGKVPAMWARGERPVYLFSDHEVRGRIKYVEDNPTFSNLPKQKWSFVVPFEASKPRTK